MSSVGADSHGRGKYGRETQRTFTEISICKAPPRQWFRCHICRKNRNAGETRISLAVSLDVDATAGFDHLHVDCKLGHSSEVVHAEVVEPCGIHVAADCRRHPGRARSSNSSAHACGIGTTAGTTARRSHWQRCHNSDLHDAPK